MAIAKTEKNIHPKDLNIHVLIQFICPVCKASKELKISKSIINQAKQLATISIPKNKICKHHFQAFIDKNFKIRGYQKVDFEFSNDKTEEYEKIVKNFKMNDEELIKNLCFQGNNLEYKPKNAHHNDTKNPKKKEIPPEKKETDQIKKERNLDKKKNKAPLKRKKMTLQEIYDEFWEFIDDNNPEFREFILKDIRRVKRL